MGIVPSSSFFSLFVVTSRLLREPKRYVNDRIVVVGASSCGVSFLETLVRSPRLVFTRLTLVSPGGLPSAEPALFEVDPAKPGLLPMNCERFARELDGAVLPSVVRIVRGKMTAIDREERRIGLGDVGGFLPYDTLVLCVGLQPRLPFLAEGVRGVLCLGCEECSEQRVGDLATDCAAAGRPLVVYGSSLEALSAAAHVRGLAGAPEVVLATPTGGFAFTEDQAVLQRVSRALIEAKGLRHLQGYEVKRAETGPTGAIEAAVFHTASSAAEEAVQCGALLVSSTIRAVDPDAFDAINASCLVFDGRLVVDAAFRTSDPSIFAGGPLAKYSRNVRDSISMSDWNSREAGQLLAQSVLRAVPYAAEACSLGPPEVTPRGTVRFSRPIATGAVIPGGTFYYHVRVPRPLASRGTPCTPIATNPADGPYLCLMTNAFGNVCEVTYMGKDVPDCDNYSALMGSPHHALNSARARLAEGAITDLVSFLREAWATAVFHDRFSAFLSDFAAELGPSLSRDVCAEIDKCVRDGAIADNASAMLDSATRQAIHTRLAAFLLAHSSQLDQFALPPVM